MPLHEVEKHPVHWIERGFQEAKSEVDMTQYEVRGWVGWHHHQALVCLAQLFLLKQRVLLSAELPLLSARELVELLAITCPAALAPKPRLYVSSCSVTPLDNATLTDVGRLVSWPEIR